MKLTRPWRVALEILGPPPIGLAAFFLYGISASILEKGIQRTSLNLTAGDLGTLAGVVLISYIFAGGQSLVFAAIMEWRFSRGLSPRSWRSVMLSSLLGLASGGVLVPLFSQRLAEMAGAMAFMGGVGLFAGFTIGILIRLGTRMGKPTPGAM